MLFLQYGEYKHAVAEAEVSIQKRPQYGPNGYRKSTVETWNITGQLHGDGPDDLSTKINDLLDAYGTNGKDLSLFTESGGNTSHAMKSANTIGGVRVTGLDFPDGSGVEYANLRTYSITVEAEFAEQEQNLMNFRETVSVVGTGGPRFIVVSLVTGPPIAQQTNAQTPVTITQSGSARGFATYPSPPAPLLGTAFEHQERRQIRRKGPQNRRGSFIGFGREWTYKFTAPSFQDPVPHQF